MTGHVVDRDGRPISGARVLHSGWLGSPGSRELGLPLDFPGLESHLAPGTIESLETDAAGAFSFHVESANPLHLALRRAGYVGRNEVRLSREPTLDLGELALETGAVLPGIVVDADDRPIAGARIEQARLSSQDFRGILQATSAVDGTFTLDTLVPGPIELKVSARGFVEQKQELSVDVPRLAEWRVVLERAVKITGRVIGAPPGTPIRVAYELPDKYHPFVTCAEDGAFVIDGISPKLDETRLRAEIPDEDEGTPLSDWVDALPGQEGMEIRVSPPIAYSIEVVDAQSRAPLSGVEFASELGRCTSVERSPGTYALSVLQPEGVRNSLVLTGSAHESSVIERPGDGAGSTHDLGTIELQALASLIVRVTRESDGTPVAGATVIARPVEADPRLWEPVKAGAPWISLPATLEGTTAEDGTEHAYLSRSRAYEIRVIGSGFTPSDYVRVDPGWPPELEVRVRRGGRVTVLCLDSAQQPVAEQAIDGQLWTDGEWTASSAVLTGPDGRARFEHLRPGRYRFGHELAEPLESDVGEGSDLELVVHRPQLGRIHGVVTDHGRPVGGAVVEINSFKSVTDFEGRYEFRDAPRGTYELLLTHPQHGSVLIEEVVAAPPETRADFTLDLVAVSGVLRGVDGKPVGEASIAFGRRHDDGSHEALKTKPDNFPLQSTRSDESGRFRFSGVQPRPGLYLLIDHPGNVPLRLGPLEFPASAAELELDAELQPAAILPVALEGWGAELPILEARWQGVEELAPEDRTRTQSPASSSWARSHGRMRTAFETLQPGSWLVGIRYDSETELRSPTLVTLRAGANPSLVLRP